MEMDYLRINENLLIINRSRNTEEFNSVYLLLPLRADLTAQRQIKKNE
jgi:hypothetical protein